MAINCVGTSQLPELIEKLTEGLPHTNTVRMIVKHARSGKLTANIYTDGWPDFTTTVCHILSPALSDEGDVMGHSTSKEKLLQVIQESGVVSWSKERWQLLHGFEKSFADYLQENLKPPPGKEGVKIETIKEGKQYYLPGEYAGPERACPEGYFLGKLEPQHTELVTSYCSWFLDTPQIQHCFESMIKNYHNVAIFQTDNPTKPIGWVLQYPYGHLAHIYVLEEFRGKGLSMILRKKMCDWIIADGDLPQYVILKPNAITAHSTKVAGFIEMFQKKSLSVGLTK